MTRHTFGHLKHCDTTQYLFLDLLLFCLHMSGKVRLSKNFVFLLLMLVYRHASLMVRGVKLSRFQSLLLFKLLSLLILFLQSFWVGVRYHLCFVLFLNLHTS